jgi:hypothetical protein
VILTVVIGTLPAYSDRIAKGVFQRRKGRQAETAPSGYLPDAERIRGMNAKCIQQDFRRAAHVLPSEMLPVSFLLDRPVLRSEN